MRLGLCCIFDKEPIHFPTTTATFLLKLDRKAQLNKLSNLVLANAQALVQALHYCHKVGIGSFRINSHILPLKTHPVVGYHLDDLPDYAKILMLFQQAAEISKKYNVRTGFHPDQFVVLNSSRPEVVKSSIAEIEYQTEVAMMLGTDTINIHVGAAYNNKPESLKVFSGNLSRLSSNALKLLTVENDDKLYTPQDLLSVCQKNKLPLVYDIHHHRCNPDSLTNEEATNEAIKTWNREPLFHISSPVNGWNGPKTNAHHDFIDVNDFPRFWFDMDVTVEVEAKAKETAISRLFKQLEEINKGELKC